MADERLHTTLAALVNGRVRHGIYKPLDTFGSGTRVLKMGLQYAEDRIGPQDMGRTQLSQGEIQRFRVHEGDLLFSRTSMMSEGAGKCSIAVAHSEAFVFDGNILCVTLDGIAADPAFYYYYFRSPAGRQAIAEIIAGTQSRSLSSSSLADISLPHPPLPEQRAIAHILGTLDNKIELNRRMNDTLEAMARAIFKSWFVDFDPVRAKAESRPGGTGLPKRIADLFPDRFDDSDLGEIPEGWEVSNIGEIADVIDCLHSKKPDRKAEGLPLLQLANIRNDGLIDMQDTYLIDEADYRKWISRMEAMPGDCVVTNVGRVGAAAQMPAGQRAALGRNMTGVRCKQAFPYPTFLIECLLSKAMREEIVQKMDSGTILDALNVRNIPKLRFVRSPKGVVRRFEELARPFRAQMERHLAESRTLAALRDTLLPKLINGEIRVRDPARFLEAVVV